MFLSRMICILIINYNFYC